MKMSDTNQKGSSTPVILAGLLAVLLIIAGVYFAKTKSSNLTSINSVNSSTTQPTPTSDKIAIQTFKSEKGSFTIDLPSDMKMLERPERIEGGVTKGEVWFTFGQFDEQASSGLVVVYGKPLIDGKGGACFDEKTGGRYTQEMIAGQKVQVCEIGGFNASYFTHPSKKIEYHIDTARLSEEQVKTVSVAVRKTLRFE